MKLCSFLVAAATSLSGAALHAQVGLYINPVAIRVSNSTADSGTFAFLGQNATSRFFWGVNFGGYYDVKKSDKFAIGGDVRDSILHGNNAGLNNFLVGLRISRPAPERFRPYLEPAVGVGTSRAPETTIHVSKVEYGIFAGVDYALGRHVDFRAFEIGYGGLTTASSETIGGSQSRTIPSATLLHFSSGFVFRIP